MGGAYRFSTDRNDILKIALVGVIIYALVRALMMSVVSSDIIMYSDNDDIMRFLSVREFLDGKGWYDKIHPRMAPPEGLHLHWSRLLDAAQAGLIGGFALILPEERAEVLGMLLWPTGLFIVLVAMTAITGRRVFGDLTAAIAILFLAIWPIVLVNYFRPVRLDHHNVQIVLGSAVVFLLILRGNATKLGLGAGLAAAFSLSVGLENLILLALAGAILAVRAIFRPDTAGRQMLSYGGAALLASVLLFAIETPRQDWMAQTCDVLSAPVLGLLAAATAISGLYCAVAGHLRSPGGRAIVLAIVSVAMLGLTAPYWKACLLGPYGHLPEAAQQVISGSIIEARPGFDHLGGNVHILAAAFPTLGAAICATGLLLFRTRLRKLADANEVQAVSTLLVFAWVGVLLTFFYQVRLTVIAAPAVPLLAGYSIVTLWRMREPARGALASLVFVAAVAITLFGAQTYRAAGALNDFVSDTAGEPLPDYGFVCRHADAMKSLRQFPQGRILAPMNYGAPILMMTDHEALAAPYHRNPDAMVNGILPFAGAEKPMRDAIEKHAADYVVMCSGAVYGGEDSFVSSLGAGQPVSGLELLDGAHPDLVVYRVVRR